MVARQPQFSPKQVAQALQASESSVKRWCDQGAIPTIRTVGGHRRITLDGLQAFLRNSHRALHQPQILGLPSLPSDREVTLNGGDHPDQQDFRAALANGDEARCRQILQRRISSGDSCFEACELLIADAMHSIGEAWECEDVDVYQERLGCTICTRLIHELRNDLPVAPGASVAIGGTPQGDPYQLPTALVELALREAGWNAISLGSNLPMDSFLQAAHDHNPQVVWLSVSAIEGEASFVDDANRLAAGLADHVALFVGGRALTDEVRSQLRYTGYCESLRNLVDMAAAMRQAPRLRGRA